MEIFIYTKKGEAFLAELDEVGECYPSEDLIYFAGVPCILSSAAPNKELT